MVDHASEFPPNFPTPDEYYPPPNPSAPYPPYRPPWPTYHNYNHTRFQYATLIVLCCGTIALVIICWKCCRKGNKGAILPVTLAPQNNMDQSQMPPPPYLPTQSPNCYESPPRYSGIFSSPGQKNNRSKNVQNKDECHPYAVDETVSYSPNIHVINIQDIKKY